ncbi:MAG: hypothetical protein ABFD25_02955, partial [Clostridiaceae bacterium]
MSNPWEDYAQPTNQESAPWEDYASGSKAEQPKEEGFFSRVGDDIKKRYNKVTDPEFYTEGMGPSNSLRAVGQVAALGSDIIGQGLKSVYKTVAPQATQDMFAEGAKNVGEFYAKPISAVAEGYNSFAKENPNLSKDIEAVGNIAQFVPMGKGAQVVGKEALNVASDAALLASQSADEQIKNVIKTGINKAIRPTVVGKRNAPQIAQYYDRATDAVKNIIANKTNLELTDASGNIVKNSLPRTLSQFSEAIDQTKKTIFRQYDDLAKQAGEEGAFVSLKPVSKELARLANDKVMNDLYPNVTSYISQRAVSLSERGAYTAEQAQEAIRLMNKSLEAFYKNPSFETASRASVDAMVVNHLRKGLDDVIEKTTGAGYQELKNSYGSLKAIEKEVAHRAVVDARKNVKGLIDFTDIFTGGELVAGLATMNPAMIARAGVQRGIMSWYKRITSPNYHVNQMFSSVEDISKRQAQGFKSKSFQKAESMFPDNPLTPGDLPPVPPGKPYREMTKAPSTEVKIPRWVGSSKTVSPMSPRTAKQLPSGQGFSLSGEPYTPEVIDAIFTAKSRPIPERPTLDMPRKDAIPELPAGQGFVFRDKPTIITETKKPVINEPQKQEFIGSGLRAARERMAGQAAAKEKVSENIVTRVQQLGGITAGKDYNSKILRQNPDAKRVLKNTGGKSPDEITAQLIAEGWPIESADELIELLKSGKGRTIFNPENLEKLHGRYIDKA